ncbi:MAG: glycine--tRNA ligase [Nanoarchaeota archaeon]
MAFIVKKKIGEKEYFYLNENKRVEGKVKTKTIAYLGKDKKEAEEKAKKILSGKIEDKSEKKIIGEKNMEKENQEKISIEEMAVFCKRKGFVFQSGEIYGGLAGFWDFGPMGVELKNNIKKEWWKYHVYQRGDIVGIDGSIVTHPKVWKASGHIDSFSDVFVVCKKCKKASKIDRAELGKVKCDFCGGDFDEKTAKDFNLMFKIQVGENGESYLRPETAQLIFADFKLVQESSRMKLPFGIAQSGKAFRNEIAPRDFIFRNREFEQMEIEYFIKPDSGCPYEIPDEEILIYSAEMQEEKTNPKIMKIKDALKKGIIKKDWHAYWLAIQFEWFKSLGANPNNFRIRQHRKDELAHYSSDCWDLEYNFPFGWKELEGIADRKDYDLSQHEKFSGKDLRIFDEETKEKILPHVVCEPSIGVERSFLVFMFDAYTYDKKRENVVLKLNPKLSPIKASIFPIVKKEEFEKIAKNIFKHLSSEWKINYDESGSIGRRYARNDEAGTPYCITIDEESIKNDEVTIRDRDTTKQIRVKISGIKETMRKLLDGDIEFENAGKFVN